MPYFDVVIVGAGAAGLFCAAQAGQRGLRVLLIDHAERVAEKIRISGGGRCNFTNRHLDPRTGHQHYLGQNPQFARSALSRFTPQHFIDLVEKNGIAFHEKHKGQLFADRSAQDIVRMLLDACALAGVQRWQPCTIETIEAEAASAPRSGPSRYRLHTSQGLVQAHNLVVATGGLSIPKIGATDFGYRIAKQFGLPIVAQRPGLVPLRFAGEDWAPYADLAGVALPVRISTGEKKPAIAFDEDLLFTHRGLSGPAILQISSYWQPGQPLTIDLLPHLDIAAALQEAKASSKKQLPNLLAQWLPTRLAEAWCQHTPAWQGPVNQCSDKALAQLAHSLSHWQITPSGTEGYAKAEVTLGGVDTQALAQQSMQAKQQPGLFFIGEVVDITGWLGGYNFQWAWSSAQACAQALAGPEEATATSPTPISNVS